MFDNLKIRSKLMLLVAVPIVIIVLLAALGAQSRLETASASRNVEKLTALARSNSDVVDALQRESLHSTAFVGSGRKEYKAQMLTARKNSDAVIKDVLDRQKGLTGTSAAFRSATTLATDAADKLRFIRNAVDQGYRWDQVATTYDALQITFLEVNDSIASTLSDPQVANDLRTAAALASFKATIALQGSLLAGAGTVGVVQSSEDKNVLTATRLNEDLTENREAEDAALRLLYSIADPDRKGEIRDALTTADRDSFDKIRDEISGNFESGAAIEIDTDAVIKATTGQLTDLHNVEVDLYSDVIARSNDARSRAESAANRFVLGGFIALLIALGAAVLMARRITRPLDRLTEAADRLSTEQMPRLVEWLRNPNEDEVAFEPGTLSSIQIDSNDEIGRLANAFNDVQRVAGEVAAEQAALLRKGIGEMFVNLARRNQALLDRQIDFIDELERSEEDPDQLENLYRLDHLATRMRRNAESLLVLAGAEPPRRRGRPAPRANVVRAALAEVEDFARIDLLSFDEILVASNVAADLAHLLSELMENATNFSPPETRVEVVGHRTKADGYVISVTDHGIGMSADQIKEANESLAKPPLVGLALSRSLGFIVVGRLAGRHGITVRMMASPSGGVTAVVTVPPTLVTDTPNAVPDGPPSAPPARSSAPSPAAPPAKAEPVPAAKAGPPPFEEAAGLAPLSFAPAADAPSPAKPAPAPAPAPAPMADPAPATKAEPAAEVRPTGPVARQAAAPTTDPATGLPNRRSKGGGDDGLPARRGAGSDTSGDDGEKAEVPAEPTEAPAKPKARKPKQAEPAPKAGEGLPARARPEPAPANPEAKPFFIEEKEPPKLFGGGDKKRPEPAEAPTSVPTPETPAKAPDPVPVAKVEPAAPASTPAPVEPPAATITADAPAPEQSTTGTGLTKRTPRKAGATRAIPGADGERGVAATKRSPDEVRNLLSGFRAGQQRARTEDQAPSDLQDDKESNE